MKLFALIIEDRRKDVEVRLFMKPEAAISEGKMLVEDSEDDDLTDQERADSEIGEGVFKGALWSYRYSVEGDSLRVMEIEVEPE